jgi:glycosyltransferase involved in cell wall biosynthesis
VTNTYLDNETPCIQDQIDALQADGLHVDVISIDRSNRLNYLRAAWRLFWMNFQPRRYNLIHAHYGHSGFLAQLQWRLPTVVTFHGSDLLYERDAKIGRIVAHRADGVIVMTEEMKDVSQRSDAQVIPFGVNTDIFHPVPMQEARQQLGLPLDEKLVLFPWDPARLVKRVDVIEAALELLRPRFGKVRLVPVYAQPRATVAMYMNACDVLAMASMHEGSPMSVREAMACNLPVVSIDVGDVADIISGIEGCYISANDPAAIAADIAKVFERGTRTDGSQHMQNLNVTWSTQRVEDVYATVLNKQRVPGPQPG